MPSSAPRGSARSLLLAALGLLLLLPFADRASGQVTYRRWDGKPNPDVTGAPGVVEPDVFHPAHQPGPDGTRPPLPEPRRGGRVIVHLSTMPRHFNYMTENSAVVRWIYYAVHESLLQRDWETWEWKSYIAKRWDVEDSVFLKSGEVKYGSAREDGDSWVVTPVSKTNPLKEAVTIPKAQIDRVEKATVYTFFLRDDITWHDGHPFDANDVYFSWKMYSNPTVDCDDARGRIARISNAEVLDDHTIRFTCNEQYFNLNQSFSDLCLTPRHIYDLSDPENPDYDKDADPLGEKQGTYINDNPHNRPWLGIGPYRIVEVNDQFVEARRYEGYFDPSRAGWVDVIRWRHIPDDEAAKTALINGELDYFARIGSDDYFGAFTKQDAFTKSYYKGYIYQPRMQYIAWNMRRPQFKDKDVRRAFAYAFDWDSYIIAQANGLGVRVTGTQFYLHPNYDHSIEPIPFDLDKAEELLDDAGWYDRDGDGIRDKDGVPLEFSFLMTPGNTATQKVVRPLQENLGKIGVKLDTVTKDWAALIESIKSKDFDCFSLAWVLDVENDPEQLWRRWTGDPADDRTSNYPGWGTPETDALIEKIDRELDPVKRSELMKELQRKIYDDQPYMFTYMVPIKFAVSKRIRNFKAYSLNPGYSIRDWYLVDDDAADSQH